MNIIGPRVLFCGFVLFLLNFIFKSSAMSSSGPDDRSALLLTIQQLTQQVWGCEQENSYLRNEVAWRANAAARADERIGGLIGYQHYLLNQLAVARDELIAARDAYTTLERAHASLKSSVIVTNTSLADIWKKPEVLIEKGKEGESAQVLQEEEDEKFDLEWVKDREAWLEGDDGDDESVSKKKETE